MKKKVIALLMAAVTAASLFAGCGSQSAETTDSKEQGKVVNIYAWNEEFKGFFEKYYKVPDGVTVNWIINPSDGGVYQDKLDEALLNQADADADEKVDMFLAEADYIPKYVDSDYTQDVEKMGATDTSQMYDYTIQAATDSNGVRKGVSFQCCPAAMIYRRSITKDVLGTDDPDKVQTYVDSWEKFDDVAAKAKEKGYYMTASYVETLRTFTNNTSEPWVDKDNNLQIDPMINAWADQAKTYLEKGYTLPSDVWGDEKNAQMFADGKTMTFFGPAWYYNFSMANAQDKEKGCPGDWAICQGPQPYFWGGTWLLAATGTDNADIVADIMNTFTVDKDVCSKLVEKEMQFSNNQGVNQEYADNPDFGNEFLGEQNDTAIYVELAKNIKFENKTKYDQLLAEKLPEYLLTYFQGTTSEKEAWANYYKYVNETYPDIVTPE